MIKRAYKYRLYPTQEQEQKLTNAFGCVRFVWNRLVDAFNDRDRKEQPLPDLKIENPFLNEVSCAILQQKTRDFIEFKKQFFNPKRKLKLPRPKFKKRGVHDSFRLPNQKFKVLDGKIQLEKIGKVSFVEDRNIPIDSKMLSITVSKNSLGQCFASVLVETNVAQLPKTEKTVGVDLGLKSFLVTSDNQEIENPRYFRENQAKLKTAQRRLSRKKKGSNRRKKQKRKVAKIHQKIANQREHFLHQVTNQLVKENDKIVIEDLNVKGMVKNGKLSKSVIDASFATFRSQLTYKCAWYGKELVVADRFFPSSKTCSCCGHVKKILPLSQRTYECDKCGLVIDRDLNAALNLSKWTPLEKNIAARVKAA